MFGRLIPVRRYSHATRETFLVEKKSRVAAVSERHRPKARIYREDSRPSFIADELFARHEMGTFVPRFRFFKTKISRLEWFDKYASKLYQTPAAEKLRNMTEECTIESDEFREVISSVGSSMSSAEELSVIDKLSRLDIGLSRFISSHFAAREVLSNYGKGQLQLDKSFIGIAVSEQFCGETSQNFETIIENFGDDILLNGRKTRVLGAKNCDYFLVPVATFVKDRDDEIYKRLSTVLVDAKADGVEINDDDSVVFDNVELSEDCIVGRVGFGKHHLRHLRDCINLYNGAIASARLNHHLQKLIEESQVYSRHNMLWADHDASRAIAADLQLASWTLDSMVRQIARKRSFIFDELQAEVSAVKVKVSDASLILSSLLQFYQSENEDLSADLKHFNEMSVMFGSSKEDLAVVGFAGLNRFYVRNQKVLKKRERSSWNIGQYMDNPDFWYKRAQKRWMMIRRPKVAVFGKDSQFSFGTHFFQHDSFINNVTRQWNIYHGNMAQHFDYLFNHNSKVISALTLILVEMHGRDINKDAYKAALIGRVGVDHFALAALHNRLSYENRLDEFADYLVREVIKLEGEQFDAMDEKFQWDHALESGFFIESRGVHKKLQDTRGYFIADAILIEPEYSENPQYLSSVEKLKLLDNT